MSLAEEIYPGCLRGGRKDVFDSPYDYTPILKSFGNIAVREDENDYQGDSWVLYDNQGRIGYLCFGWGSCSGCDALQACDSYAEIDDLIDSLRNRVKWFDSKFDALEWFKSHDWEGDYCADIDDFKKFLSKALSYLTAPGHS